MKESRFTSLVFVVLGAITAVHVGTTTHAWGGNDRFVGRRQAAGVSLDEVDHDLWDRLLVTYVDDDGRVNYKGWKASDADVKRLDQYLAQLSAANPRASAKRQSRLAFWINAYNAVTVRGILYEYPTTSIRNHTAKLWGYNIWKHLKLFVGGEPFSLDQMEHQILRSLSEPRIHFAIVCASIGCPRLLNRAYRSDRLEVQLENAAKDFFARPQNFRHDVGRRQFAVSAILDWFDEDFGESQQALLRRISPWLPTVASREAARGNDVSLVYLDYDWNLNQQ